ncbi:hypothetical protein JOE31_002674 [Arthrobacter sp. PvP023]|uniref:hypothetical protein n=1 Tax=Micrococcaceae TaxID=1268 RepID=UPI001AE10094|nr:hypothetical protein [Arthrobacter sp. PvP023]MBP1136442.1 hypothetical protein [Arthrobacter sp. PvP023]
MNKNTVQQGGGTSGLPTGTGDARDFIAVDDSGEFSYHGSEQDLLSAFEYVEEVACVVDRSGGTHRLALDSNRHLILGPSRGPVEFHWLRQAWLDAQNAHPERHRLRRFFPLTRDEVVADLFETLVLEHGPEPAVGSWTMDVRGMTSQPAGLVEVDRRLARRDLPEHVHVKDPFGHVYRPLRHRRHWYLPATAGFNLYIEVPPPPQ